VKGKTFKTGALLSFAIGVALLAAAPPVHSEAPVDWQELVGMRYLAARKVILSHGWRPSHGECQGIAVDCRQFPEINTCSGVELGLCGMHFVRRNRCLTVTTVGGPPSRERKTDTWVQAADSRRGRC
jgi:hypothetical protein